MSKKGENIRKRKDGSWEGRYSKGTGETGKALYISVYGKTYKEVKEKMRHIRDTVPLQLPARDITFDELLERWKRNNSISLKGGTKTKYDNLIEKHINPELGNLKLSEIDAYVVNNFLVQKLQNGRLDGCGSLSPSYVRSMSLVICSALDQAANEGLCKPMRSLIRKPSILKDELHILTHEKQLILEEHIRHNPTPTNVGIMISLYTGLRIGEICALSWDDIDLDSKIIRVRHTVSRIKAFDKNSSTKTQLILDEPKTRSSKRQIPIPSPLLPILDEYKKISISKYVVSDKDSFISPRTYEHRYCNVLKACGIEHINYHALRHTFATRCIEVGVDTKSLSEILGHADVCITLNTYVHSSLKMKKSQLEKLASLYA